MLPALFAFGCGALVLVLRPALPIDETRYLEVLRECLAGDPVLLHLRGRPYAEKPPLLFWLAELLSFTGLSPQVALRLIPGLAAGLTVLFTARVGRRVGLGLAGWVQATMLMAFLVAQVLLFDTLLACGVWAAVDAWSRGRDRGAALGAALALMAKGPVALLFLAPLLWSFAPLRPSVPGATPRGTARRGLAILGVGLVPLVAWAVAAAIEGGPEFARALLWDRWAGRVVSTFAHRRSMLFYVPVVLVGALPVTPLLFRRLPSGAEAWARRLARSLLALLVIFTLISGKQAHYVVPALPGIALLAALHLERGARGPRALLLGVRAELLLLAAAVIAAFFLAGRLAPATSDAGRAYLAAGGWRVLLGAVLAVLVLGFGATLRRPRPLALLGIAAGGLAALAFSAHRMAGPLLYPYELERALALPPDVPVARLGAPKNGLFELFTGRERIPALADPADLLRWSEAHPGGVIVVERGDFPGDLPAGFEVLAEESVHNDLFVVLRVPAR